MKDEKKVDYLATCLVAYLAYTTVASTVALTVALTAELTAELKGVLKVQSLAD